MKLFIILFEIDTKRKSIKPFHETFKVVSFMMSAGLLYPNPATDQFRFRALAIVYVSVTPIICIFLIDLHESWMNNDIQNMVRHCTLIIPFILVLSKMGLMYISRSAAQKIVEEINRDHEELNYLPEHYQPIIASHFRKAKFGEKYWLITVIYSVSVFPVMALKVNFYEYSFKDEPQKEMIHDVNLPFMEPEGRFESPYFELMFTYMLYCCVIYFYNFIGYDGFFGIAIRHACLKMKLYCHALDDAMKLNNVEEIIAKIVEVIKAQCRFYEYVGTIQTTFNIWLGMIFIGTIVHICNCMYQIIEGLGFDVKYTVFIMGSLIHIYLPCSYSSDLKRMSADTSTMIYTCGWERVPSQRVRWLIQFMIARNQLPTVMTAFNMLTFDMELFVSMLNTSYSMFTLLRPRKEK